jgi:hypothetical protein
MGLGGLLMLDLSAPARDGTPRRARPDRIS